MIKISNLTLAVLTLAVVSVSSCTQVDSTSETSSVNEPVLRIAAASNLAEVLPAVIKGYTAARHLDAQDIEVTYASSGKLYAQIKAGAPYDVFLAANQAFPARLAQEQQSKVATYQPFTYTQGQLALYSVTKPVNELSLASLHNIAQETDSKVTIANPELAPYGASATAYLQQQNLYDTLVKQNQLIQAENIGQAFQYAHTGSADYGFVAQPQVLAIQATPEQFITLPINSYPAILQDGIVTSDKPMALDFSTYLRSKQAQDYFANAGYLAIK